MLQWFVFSCTNYCVCSKVSRQTLKRDSKSKRRQNKRAQVALVHEVIAMEKDTVVVLAGDRDTSIDTQRFDTSYNGALQKHCLPA